MPIKPWHIKYIILCAFLGVVLVYVATQEPLLAAIAGTSSGALGGVGGCVLLEKRRKKTDGQEKP